MSSISMHIFTGRISRPATGVALALTMVAAACSSAPGGGAPGAPAGTGPGGSQPPATSVAGGGAVPADMCSLISGEDIATIVGKDLDETTPEGSESNSCTWTFTGDGTVIASAEDDPGLFIENWGGAFPPGEDVSIGDRGFWTPGLSVLYVQKGVQVYTVQLILFDQAESKDMAIKVAQLLLAKL